jgi:hypothetical protein
MSYVDAGYAVALATLFVYGLALVLRRRRWERVLRTAEPPEHTEGARPVAPDGPT